MPQDLAQCFDIDTRLKMWQERVAAEINFAVLHSFNKAKATISDHYRLGEQVELNPRVKCTKQITTMSRSFFGHSLWNTFALNTRSAADVLPIGFGWCHPMEEDSLLCFIKRCSTINFHLDTSIRLTWQPPTTFRMITSRRSKFC